MDIFQIYFEGKPSWMDVPPTQKKDFINVCGSSHMRVNMAFETGKCCTKERKHLPVTISVKLNKKTQITRLRDTQTYNQANPSVFH